MRGRSRLPTVGALTVETTSVELTMRPDIRAMPLSMMVLWKSPWDMRDKTCQDTLVPPADLPKMVTQLGSPPKWRLDSG